MKADKNTLNRFFRRISKPVWNIAGSIFVALGVIGIFVPLLPTTVFLLLGAACYNKGSERFHHWLINNRTLGPYIVNFHQNKGIPMQAKVKAIAVLWITIAISIYFINNLYVTLILVLVAVSVSLYLITRKTLKT